MSRHQISLFSDPGPRNALLPSGLLEEKIARFIFPEDLEARRTRLQPFVKALQAGRLAKEISVHGDFLVKVFEGILGYTGKVAGGEDGYTLQAEMSVAHGGGSADGALGFFGRPGREDRLLAPVELKGSEADLDKPVARGFTPVQQGFNYANAMPDCPWVIVSNYRETRLYNVSKGYGRSQRFELERLLDPDEFKRFYYCLCVENLVCETGPSVLSGLVKEAGEAEIQITNRFYKTYQSYRLEVIDGLILANSEAPREILIEKAQKLLDRALFIAFCKDRGLLKSTIIQDVYAARRPGEGHWAGFQSLFNALQNGDRDFKIPAYNGGLFAPDAALDTLKIPEQVADVYLGLARHDFKSQLDVDILGHVFEQSVTDLEIIRKDKLKARLYEGVEVKEGKRKKQGIVYTPAFITRFIFDRTVGRLLAETRARLEEKYKLADAYDEEEKRKAARAFWTDYGAALEGLRILDPACGSGAFLIAAFDALKLEYDAANRAMQDLAGKPLWPNANEVILGNNLYGVDLAPESVEITKLSLWLKTAQPEHKLAALDETIRCGNSLVEAEAVDPRAVFWRRDFQRVMDEGGFDVVFGNPPYVRIQHFREENPAQADYFGGCYGAATSNYDLYVLFVERGLNLLKPSGILGYILPNKFFTAEYGEGLRRLIAEKSALLHAVDMDRNQVFEGVTTYPALLFLRAGTERGLWHHLPDGAPVEEDLRLIAAGQGPTPTEVPAPRLTGAPWSFRSGAEGVLLDRLKAMRPTLGDLSEKIFQGLVTSADPVFIMEDRGSAGDGYRKLFRPKTRHKGTGQEVPEREVLLEEAFLKPLFKDGHMEPFFMGPPGHRIIFPYDLSGERPALVPEERLKNEAPKTWAWFEEHRDLLRARENGKMGRTGWWGYVYPKNLDAFEGPKIMVPGFSDEQRFSYDRENTYFTGRGDSGYGIRLNSADETDALYALAVLNSQLAGYFQKTVASAFQGGFYSSGKRYLAQIPVPDAPSALKAALADLCRTATDRKARRFDASESVRHRLRVDVLGNPFAPLSKKLDAWPALSFKQIQDELFKTYKKTLPLQDRGPWERLIEDQRAAIQTLTRDIESATRALNEQIYELYGLSQEEIRIVEGE